MHLLNKNRSLGNAVWFSGQDADLWVISLCSIYGCARRHLLILTASIFVSFFLALFCYIFGNSQERQELVLKKGCHYPFRFLSWHLDKLLQYFQILKSYLFLNPVHSPPSTQNIYYQWIDTQQPGKRYYIMKIFNQNTENTENSWFLPCNSSTALPIWTKSINE